MSQSPIRVLLVEDDPDAAYVLQTELERRGFDIVVAESAAGARTAARDRDFDVVVSDLSLPDGDGCALLGDLRMRQSLAGVALTGWDREEDRRRSKRAGFAEHLVKPVSAQTIESVLRRLVVRD